MAVCKVDFTTGPANNWKSGKYVKQSKSKKK